MSSSTTPESLPIDAGVTVGPVDEPPAASRTGRGVLVIGGAGFIGSHLVDRLIAEGEAVDVVDDLSTGSLAHLADARAAVATGVSSELRISTLDAGSDSLTELVALRRPREIYHLALLPRQDAPPVAHGRAFNFVLRVLEAARRHHVEKVVVVLPANALYGHPAGRDLPVKEGAFVPRGVRGVVAKAIIDLLNAYREQYDIEFTALATTTVYGPRQRPDGGVVASMLAAARRGQAPRLTGDGRQTRDFVFIDDVVDALVRSGRQRRRARRQRRDRGADVASRSVDGDRPRRSGADAGAGPIRRAVALRRISRACPHPPGLVAVDRTGRRAQRAALSVVLARWAATPGSVITEGTTSGRIPAAATAGPRCSSTGSMTSVSAIGA